MERIEITLPLPPPEMHPNKRHHWRAKMKPKAKQRDDARIAALARLGSRMPPQWPLAEVQSTWYLARRNDHDNLIAWAKATWDGLADAGIVGNDRGFVFLPPVQVTGKEARGARKLVVVVTKREKL